MNNAPVVLGTSASFSFTSSGLSFNNMNAAGTYLTLTAPLSSVGSVTNLHFNTPVTTGKYFTTSAPGGGWNFIVSSGGLPTAPSFVLNTNYTKAAGMSISWNGTAL
jgi:hypothetical protein